jgi:hypothetical protein
MMSVRSLRIAQFWSIVLPALRRSMPVNCSWLSVTATALRSVETTIGNSYCDSASSLPLEEAVTRDASARQLGDERKVDGVAGLLGQVFLDLDDRVLVRAHVPVEAVLADVVGEEVIIPNLLFESSRYGRKCH